MEPTPLKAWEFYLKRFPNAGTPDAQTVLGVIGSLQTFTVHLEFALERLNELQPWVLKDVSPEQYVEEKCFPQEMLESVLLLNFGIDIVKYPEFQYHSISDAFHWDKEIKQLFKRKSKMNAQQRRKIRRQLKTQQFKNNAKNAAKKAQEDAKAKESDK